MILTILGSILFFHASYSCLHYRALLNDLEESGMLLEPQTLPPADVVMEVMIAFGLIMVGELVRTGSSLQPVVGKKRPLMAPAYFSRDFDVYSTRGSAL